MPTPNGGLITETNAQYYAGAQQKYTSAGGINETITSTFDTNLVVGTGNYADPATNGYNLNSFKIYTSPDANTWTELTPDATNQTATATGNGGVASATIQLAAANTSIIAGMTIYGTTITGNPTGAKVVSMNQGTFVVTLDAAIAIPGAAATNAVNFKFDQPWSMSAPNVITIAASLAATSYFKIQLNENTLWDSHGSYEYTKLYDVIDNFLIAYVGAGKLIPSVKRTDVIFHAKRGLQEFSYDTLKSIKSQELTVPSSLALIIPQDYVNYVSLSWADELGVLHPIYPTNNLNQSPYFTPTQDNDGVPVQDSNDSNTEVTSKIDAAWDAADPRKISGGFKNDLTNANVLYRSWYDGALGQRYGLTPQTSQKNGWFKIDERKGTFNFTSNLSEKIILLEYISDGNAYSLDARIPKLAEEALYAHILYSILSTSVGIQEYVVRRFKQERSAKLRNAKIRLSNIKLDQIVQVMRGKAKWIK